MPSGELATLEALQNLTKTEFFWELNLMKKINPIHKVLDKVISEKALLEMMTKCQHSCQTREIRIYLQPLLTILARKHHVLMFSVTTAQTEQSVKAHVPALVWQVLAWDLPTQMTNQVGPR